MAATIESACDTRRLRKSRRYPFLQLKSAAANASTSARLKMHGMVAQTQAQQASLSPSIQKTSAKSFTFFFATAQLL